MTSLRVIIGTTGALLALGAPLRAADLPPPPERVRPIVGDTILWTPPYLRTPGRSLLQGPPPDPAFVRLGQARIPVTRWGPSIGSPGREGDFVPATPDWSLDRLFRLGTLGRVVAFGDVPDPVSTASPTRRAAESSRLQTEYADLGFSLRGTGQFGGDWTTFRPCDETVQVTCDPSLLPQLRPDIDFAASAEGTVAERILVDVDYDQTREFAGANRVNIHYQGAPGELVQRIDVGDVRFELPRSHYLRQAVPAGNFGFQAALEAGPVDIESVWAQQDGEVTSRRFRLETAGRGFSQSDTVALDDADFVDGQFFFLFDPRSFFEYPHIDVLSVVPSDAPQSVVPGGEPIQLYRSEIDLFAQQQVEGSIQADAFAGEGPDSVAESAWFRYLRPGQDYVVHPSGLWVALRSPLRPDEMLAVTYITASGDTVGTYNPEGVYRSGGRPTLRLLKATSGQHQPDRPTWETEMHQVYRVSSSNDVDPGTVDLTISVGEASAGRTFARRLNGDDITYLRLFGLDEEAPVDRIDESQLYRPALDSFDDQPPVSGTFIVFPTLEPFATPAPLPSLSLDPGEVSEILGSNRNEQIYRALDPFERENGGVFRLNLAYEVRSEGLVSSFALGAVGIREGTERITLGERALLRDVDYIIDYDIGQLTLTSPDALLASTPGRVLEASWEQRSFFQVAPTSVFGLNAQYDLGDYGALNLIGLYQSEDELVRRPQLGVEAAAVGLGGLNGNVSFQAPVLTRLLNAVPGLDLGGESTVRLSGETTVSLPNPNTQGAVYLDDYDALNSRRLSVQSPEWRRGSRPGFRDGAETALPPVLDEGSLAEMTWQHSWIVESVTGDSLGVFQGFNPNADIDQQIRITGSVIREPGLFVRFEPESGDVEGDGAWSSMTTVLSPTGTDLTKSEFIEFYVRDGDFLELVLDVGVVSEDAFFVDDEGAVNGVKAGSGVSWGLGILDQEANPRIGEVWGNLTDGRGVWDEPCFAERARIYRIGDPRANCTRGNGRPDSEDLDEDGNLDTVERYRRFVIPLDGTSPFMVRDRMETGSNFRLYRVPLRDPTAIDVGGDITEAELRAVRHLRITVAGQRRDSFVLARMGIVGSTWIKRSLTGVLTGFGGDTIAVQGRVEVSPVSKLTVGDAYSSPPGVLEQLDDPTTAFGGQGIEFNERALSVSFDGVQPGDRVEVYNRFPQRPRDFLSYREARVWAVATKGDFGLEVPTWFFVKVGTDDENFYLFRTRLDPAASPVAVSGEDWLPELVIRFDEWLDLRRRAEELLILEPRLPGDPPLVLWSADSTYAVTLKDRGRAPNLASVRELSLGVMNETGAPVSGEVWVDELRLARGIRDGGVASAFDAEVRAGEFLRSRVAYRNRGGFFRQLRGTPTFQDDKTVDVQTTLQLDRFTPDAWGLDVPLSVSHQRESQEPIFLGRSDVRADQLEGLRDPGYSRTRVDIALRRTAPVGEGIWNSILDGLDVRAGLVRSSFRTITTESDGDGVDAFVGYTTALERRDLPLFPGPLASALRRILPDFLDDRVAGARFRWTPEVVRIETELLNRDLRTLRFDQIIRTPGDTSVTATEAPRRLLTSVAQVTLRPFESVTAAADVLSGRDLLDVERLAGDPATRELLASERRRVAGVDLGWEVDRQLRTRLAYQPRLSSWARANLQVTTIYFSERNADLIESRQTPFDTTLALQRNVDGQRNLSATVSLDPGQIAGQGGEAGPFGDWWSRFLDPVSVTYSDGLTSRFNREAVDPGSTYQLGWGGRERFLKIGADSAATLSERDRLHVRGGVRLPWSSTIGWSYDRSRNETLDTRSDREVLRRVWPDLRFNVADVGVPRFLARAVERVSVGSGYRKETRSLAFGSGTQQDRFREDREVPVSVALTFARGLTLTYRGRVNRGEGSDPTGDTNREANSHTFLATARLRSPLSSFRDRGAPMRVTVDLRYTDELQCRIVTSGSPCVGFIDQLERSAALSLDSAIRDFQLGVQLRYVDRRSFVGQRSGSTQFQLNIFGQFLLTAGMFPNPF